MVVNLTVAIPTYNGERRLPEVLERLRLCCKEAWKATIHKELFSCEILVIDNNSTDDTAKVVRAYQANWPNEYPLRYCFEPRQGAGYARHRAIKEAKSPLVGFLDDDNIPALDWIVAAYRFAQSHPTAGAFGSRIRGDYEVNPPDNFERLAPFLAITERGAQPLLYEPHKKLLPPSAGLVVRRQAWLESVPPQQILTGPTSNNILASEDLEMVSYIQANGWEIWYNPAMLIDHKIPGWRLEREYLMRFFRGIGLSRHVTRMLSVKPWQRPAIFVAYLVNDLRKIILHLFKYGLRVQSDLIAACEMQLFISSLISPFYLWKNGYFGSKEQ